MAQLLAALKRINDEIQCNGWKKDWNCDWANYQDQEIVMLNLNELLKNLKKIKELSEEQRKEVEKLISSVKKDDKNKEKSKND